MDAGGLAPVRPACDKLCQSGCFGCWRRSLRRRILGFGIGCLGRAVDAGGLASHISSQEGAAA